MKKNKLGNTGLYVTPVSFGVMTVGEAQLNLPLEEGAALIKYAVERGINFFDTAQYYKTYDFICEAIKDMDEKPIICSKTLDASYEGAKYAVDQCLREVGIEYVDIFLLHEVRQGEDFDNRAGAWRYLQEAKAQGIVKAIGVSTHHIDVTEKMADIPQCDVVFPLINFAGLGIRQGNHAGTKEDMAAAIKKCHNKGKGIFLMKAFGGGNLTGNYLEALDYAFSVEGMNSVMVGIGRKEEIDRLVEYAEGTIDRNYVPDITDKKIRIDPGDCEVCGACIDRCPNHAISLKFNSVVGYNVATVDDETCLTCGYCAPVCPVRAIIMF